MKKIFIIILIFLIIKSFSQVLKGKVSDQNNVPLSSVNVFLDGTTIATITDNNGNFSIKYGAKSNSVLVISYLGYQTEYLSNIDTNQELKITLTISSSDLKEVIVTKDRFSRKQKLQLFKEKFLGTTPNGRKTFIENEDDIYFEYNEKQIVFFAFSDNPIVIINQNLGYKIYFELTNFEINFYKLSIKSLDATRSFYAGVSRFEEISTTEKVIKNRQKAYQGSQLHFFRNLTKNIWGKENFMLFLGKYQVDPNNYFSVKDENDYKVVTVSKQERGFNSDKYMASFNLLFNKKQQSQIIFETPTFQVDKFGNNSNIENIIFSGYLSEQKVGDMLPMNYGIQ